MSLTDAREAEGTTEPNNDTTGGAAGVSDYHAQIQSWYHMPPGDHLSPSSKSTYKSPYAPSTYVSPYAKHHAVSKLQSPPAELPPRQGPPLGEGLMESQSASGTSHRQPTHTIQTAIPRDPAPDPSVQSPQTDTTSGLQSPELIIEPENGTAALPPASGSQSRQRCEVWPMGYRSADGWLKTFWCVQVDGESSYQYETPNWEELSSRYDLVYFPDMHNAT